MLLIWLFPRILPAFELSFQIAPTFCLSSSQWLPTLQCMLTCGDSVFCQLFSWSCSVSPPGQHRPIGDGSYSVAAIEKLCSNSLCRGRGWSFSSWAFDWNWISIVLRIVEWDGVRIFNFKGKVLISALLENQGMLWWDWIVRFLGELYGIQQIPHNTWWLLSTSNQKQNCDHESNLVPEEGITNEVEIK